MPVPTLVTDLSTTLASNSPAGSDNVFPDLDNYLRAMSGFIASIRDNSGNGWVSPYLPLTYSAGTANGVVYLNGSKVVTTGSGLVFDGSNLGLGVTPSAWGAGAKAVQFSSGAFAGAGISVLSVGNAYFDGTDYRYLANGFAAYHAVNNGAGQHAFYVAPSGTAGNAISFTEAMRLDASGNLAVGTSSAVSSRIHAEGNGVTIRLKTTGAIGSGSTCFLQYDDSVGDSAYVGFGGTANSFDIYNRKNGPMVFATNGTPQMRLDASGNLLVGTTSAIASDCKLTIKNSTSATVAAGFWNAATSGDNLFAGFYTEATITVRGSISYNRAGGLVAYNTTSDYRAKDILGPVADPGATIDALKVYEGRMKGATQSRPMLVAHEAQEVTPYAVSGVKDEVNEDGTPKFQQIDVSSLVPLLLAEIQQLRARVAALEQA
jgi:hypothetical protein